MTIKRQVALAASTIVLMVLGLEGVMRVLPVSTATETGYHHDPDLLTYPTHHQWTVASGWDLRNVQRLRSNSSGFAADREFARDPEAVVLIGDSFVEASAIAAEYRPAAQLTQVLGDGHPVIGLGMPGTALVDYAQRVRFANQQFGSRRFVIWLEATDLRQSLCGSGHVVSRCLSPVDLTPQIQRQAPAGAVKQVLRHSALAQYVFSQLKFNPQRAWSDAYGKLQSLTGVSARSPFAQKPSAKESAARAAALADAAVSEFMAQVSPYRPERLLFIVDVNHDGVPQSQHETEVERQALMRRLRAGGLEVLDLQPVYEKQHAKSPLALEIGPYDHHLNPVGVRLVMSAVADHLASR